MSRAKHRLHITADDAERFTVPAIAREVRRRERRPLPVPRGLISPPEPPGWPVEDRDLPRLSGDLPSPAPRPRAVLPRCAAGSSVAPGVGDTPTSRRRGATSTLYTLDLGRVRRG